MSLNSLNQKLKDKTAKESNFSCSRTEMGPVKTEADKQFMKTLRLVIVLEKFQKIIFNFLTSIKFNRF